MSPLLRRLALAIGLFTLAGALSGCIVEEDHWHHGGYGYWHHY